jgi:hypothetical protein
VSDAGTKSRQTVLSSVYLPQKPNCDVFHLKLEAERPLQAGQFRDILKALTAHYYPGAEPPGMKITDEDRSPERLNSIIVALRGNGHRLEYLPLEETTSVSGKEVALMFWIAR